jgi:hypothetical protein
MAGVCKMDKFKVGDEVTVVTPTYSRDATVLGEDEDGLYLLIGEDGFRWWEESVFVYERKPSAQQRLDMLAKYFTSGNDVPVKQATIKASDFWKIYNGEV